MPKLSDFDQKDIVIEEPKALKLSDIHPDDIQVEQPSTGENLLNEFESGSFLTPAGRIKKAAASGARFLEGASGGLLTEGIAGAGALGENMLESSGLKSNTGRSLSDLYKEYKTLTDKGYQDLTAPSGMYDTVTGGMFELAGSIVGPGKLVKGASKLGKLTTLGSSLGIGAVEGFGKSEASIADDPSQLAKDTAIGAGVGTLGGLAGEGVSKGIGYLADKASETPLAKQFAATVLNKARGGTLFTDTGKEAVEQESRKMVSDISDELIDPLTQKNKEFGKAFGIAKDQKQVLSPDISSLTSVNNAESMISNAFGKDALSDYFGKLKSGSLTPEDANAFRTEIKDLITKLYQSDDPNPAIKKLAKGLQSSGIIESLESLSKKAGTDIGKLNAEKANAYQILEQLIPGIRENRASALADDQIVNKTKSFLSEILEKAGLGTTRGTEGSVDIKELYNKVKQLKTAGNINIDEEEIARKLQNQSMLEAARKNVSGYTEQSDKTIGKLVDKIKPKKLSIYGIAEAGAESKNLQDVSKYLLEANNERLLGVANRLKGDKNYAHLGNSLADAVQKNVRPQINAVLFTMMQNPATRALVQGMQESITPEM